MDVQYIEEWATIKIQVLSEVKRAIGKDGFHTDDIDAKISVLNELLEEIGRKAEQAEMGRQSQNDMA